MVRLAIGLSTPNLLAAVLAVVYVVIPMLIVACARGRWRMPALIGCNLLAMLTALAIGLTASRGGMVAALAGHSVGMALLSGRWRLVPLALIMVLVVVATVTSMGTRLQATSRAQPSVATRLYVWRVSAVLAHDHPWSGVGAERFGAAVAASAEMPAHLRSEHQIPFGWANNDVLDAAAKHGAIAGVGALGLALLSPVLGLWAWRREKRLSGAFLAAGGTAWLVAGMFSCVWFYDPVASSLGWTMLGSGSLAAAWALGWRKTAMAAVVAIGCAALVLGSLIVGAGALAGDQPRLVAVDGPVPWYLLPRRASLGSVIYLRGREEDAEETVRHALRPIAESGFSVSAVDTLDQPFVLPAPRIIIARAVAGSEALAALSLGTGEAAVLLDPLSWMSANVPKGAQVIALHGHLVPLADRQAWAERLGHDAHVLACGRLWANRMAVAWPIAMQHLERFSHPPVTVRLP